MKNRITSPRILAGLAAVALALTLGANSASAAKGISDISTEQQPNVPAGWITSYDGALELAKKEDRPILINFTGSDWCGWCKKMDKETYSQSAFENYAKNNLVLLYVDFPSGKPQTSALEKQNDSLKSKFGVRGYPTQVLLSPDGKLLWKNPGYLKGGPGALISNIKQATAGKS